MSKVSKPLPHPPTGASPVIPEQLITLSKLYARNAIPRTVHQPRYIYDESLNNKIAIWRGDITRLKSTVIVNPSTHPSTPSLSGNGGVDLAIHRAAGPDLLTACMGMFRFGLDTTGIDPGETVLTQGYNLPARYVAHTISPVYSSHTPDKAATMLASCYRTSMTLLARHGGGTIGFPCISTGRYGYPMEDATRIALQTVRDMLLDSRYGHMIKRVVFVVFSEWDEETYQSVVAEYFPGPPGKGTAARRSGQRAFRNPDEDDPPPPYQR